MVNHAIRLIIYQYYGTKYYCKMTQRKNRFPVGKESCEDSLVEMSVMPIGFHATSSGLRTNEPVFTQPPNWEME